jgi:hypothetical protein
MRLHTFSGIQLIVFRGPALRPFPLSCPNLKNITLYLSFLHLILHSSISMLTFLICIPSLLSYLLSLTLSLHLPHFLISSYPSSSSHFFLPCYPFLFFAIFLESLAPSSSCHPFLNGHPSSNSRPFLSAILSSWPILSFSSHPFYNRYPSSSSHPFISGHPFLFFSSFPQPSSFFLFTPFPI